MSILRLAILFKLYDIGELGNKWTSRSLVEVKTENEGFSVVCSSCRRHKTVREARLSSFDQSDCLFLALTSGIGTIPLGGKARDVIMTPYIICPHFWYSSTRGNSKNTKEK